MSELHEKTTEFKREEIRKLLVQCTEKEIAFFNRLYGSIDAIPEENMNCAYGQCKRTLEWRAKQ